MKPKAAKKSPPAAPSPEPSTAPPKVRKRTVYVAFWLFPEEAAALMEAENTLAARTGKTRQRGEHLRDMVKRFVREVRMSNEFTE